MRLTASQELMWTGQRVDPASPLYNMAFLFEIQGPLDPERFRSAFARVAAASDALRLRFSPEPKATGENTAARQTVTPELAGELRELDFSADPEPLATARTWAQRQTEVPYSLGGTLWRSALLRLGPDHYAWWLDQHHLITDAASCAVLFRQISDQYADETGSAEIAEGADRSLSFADYCALERNADQQPGAARRSRYWTDFAARKPEPWSVYGHSPARRTTRSRRHRRMLSVAATQRLFELADLRQSGALSVDIGRVAVLTALTAALLARLGGAARQRIGLLSGNRDRSRRDTLGCLIETCPLDIDIDAALTLRTLVRRATIEVQQAIRHSAPGVSRLTSAAEVPVILNYLPYRFTTFAGMNVATEWLHSGNADAGHLLRLQVCQFADDSQLELLFDLNESAFSIQEQRWLPEQFLKLAETWLTEPDRPLHSLTFDDPALAQRRLTDFNATVTAPAQRDLLELLSSGLVDRERLACRDRECELSSAELQHCRSVLAQQLADTGVGPGTLVPVLMRPSLEAIIAVHAVLLTGAAFVPLDPEHPPARIESILKELADASAQRQRPLINDPNLNAPAINGQLVAIDQLLAQVPRAFSGHRRVDDQLCYVLYTSGSTGTPKGVRITDRGLCNYLLWALDYYAARQPVAMPLFTSLAFDATLTSLFLPTVSGGAVHVYNDPNGNGSRALREIFRDDAVDLCKLTPSHLALLPVEQLTSTRVRGLILGGEILPRALAERVVQHWPGAVTIYNEYGPTETVIGCSVHCYDPARDTRSAVPIGRPIANSALFVLDENLDPVPTGVVGELCISGPGVAQGYLNRPQETAARFVQSPFDATSLLYRTGDLARWLDEDELEFLGRDDRQIKLHGQRIELDEIATTLMSHPEVTAAAVQLNRLETEAPETFCKSCGLSSRYPEIRFDAAGICSTCSAFEGYRQELDQYFRSLPELEARFRQLRDRRQGDYDCLMLLSGGKDSTYVLYQLAAMDLDILTFTLDNGYISEGAKANIRRVTEHLGIDHVFATTEHMPEIFADSLARYSNVCNGCFKTIYTLSMNLARERGIPSIVTGLARGQLFETRLVDMCSAEQFDPATIDTTVAAARKAYHRIPDAPTRLLPVKIFEDDRIFDEIEFIDFFRYCDVELAEMYSFLADHAPWVRPQDTGRSTNCLINDTGIHVHKLERGYHNYALPYSWDVRLGHKTRSAAMAELDDQIDVDRVSAILAEIGYQPKDRGSEQSLTAFYTAGEELASRALRDWLAERLPPYMLPTHFVRLPALPLTANGKVDYAGLPQATRRTAQDTTPPRNDLERALTELWQARFGLTQIGIHEDFFELGGDSVLAIQLVDTAAADGLSLEPRQLFEYPTIAELATELASSTAGRAAQRAPAAPQVAASESDRARVLAALKQRSEDRSGHG